MIPAAEDARTRGPRGPLRRIVSGLLDSPWASLAGKAALSVVVLVTLAAVGARTAPGAAGATVRTEPFAAAEDGGSPGPRTAPPRTGGPSPKDGGTTVASDASIEGAATGEPVRIALNRASEEELMKLPGIGPARARAIVELRARLGRFRRPEDLLRVRGIGRKTLRRLLPMLEVDPPRAVDGGA